MSDHTTAAWALARLVRGESVKRIAIPELPDPYRGIAQALTDRSGREAMEVFTSELAKLPPETAHQIRAAVLTADPQGPMPSNGELDEELELLDTTPLAIRKPLTLLDGRAYAATWVSLRRTVRAEKNKDGKRVEHRTPVVTHGRALCLVRDDGVLFSDVDLSKFGRWERLADLGLGVNLPMEGDPAKVWSGAGVKRYLAGERPDPLDVFRRLVDVVSRFLDFDMSLASQFVMAALMACYILASYLLDAFDVVGYLWSNGEGGSGKSTLLQVVAELGYLGVMTTMGGTFAALRDLSDYGAVLCFDDAENIAGGKHNQDKVDPDKRTLLLAGNRRGNVVPLKEPTPQKTWRTRYVSTFCPRSFSATQLPDPLLAGRSIIVPLVRTMDKDKANFNPASYAAWPHNRNRLIDDLWAMGLAYLPELPPHVQVAQAKARLASRALEPWLGILGVAHWLTERGAANLFEELEALSVKYQSERAELETFNAGLFAIRALVELASSNPDDPLIVTTSRISEVIKQFTTDGEGTENPDDGVILSPHKIGHLLRQWRIQQLSRPGGKGPRRWSVPRALVHRLALSHGIDEGNIQ